MCFSRAEAESRKILDSVGFVHIIFRAESSCGQRVILEAWTEQIPVKRIHQPFTAIRRVIIVSTLFFPRAILIFSGNFSWVLFSYNSILKSGILTQGSTGYCTAQPLGWGVCGTVIPQGRWCDLQWPQKVFGYFQALKSNLKYMNFITLHNKIPSGICKQITTDKKYRTNLLSYFYRL